MMMTTACRHCCGTGDCPECDGSGQVPGGCIENADLYLHRRDPAYELLCIIQDDAKRLRRQTEEMCRLVPQYAGKFQDQMRQLMSHLDKVAQKIAEP